MYLALNTSTVDEELGLTWDCMERKSEEKKDRFSYHWRSVALVRMSKLNFVSYGPLIGTDLFEKKEKKILFVGLNSPIAQ